MKISTKLSQQITSSIFEGFQGAIDEIENKFRRDEMSHSVWREIHSKLISTKHNVATEVLTKIDSYTGQR